MRWRVKIGSMIVLIMLLGPISAFSLGLEVQLLKAVEKGDIVAVKNLLAKGVNVNAILREKHSRFTAVMIASSKGHTEIVKELLAKGADVNAKNQGDKSAYDRAVLHHKAYGKNEEVIQVLVENGALGTENAEEEALWHIAEGKRNILSYYQEYLQRFPKGKYADTAKEFIAWADAERELSIASIQAYLAKYTEGYFSIRARANIILINQVPPPDLSEKINTAGAAILKAFMQRGAMGAGVIVANADYPLEVQAADISNILIYGIPEIKGPSDFTIDVNNQTVQFNNAKFWGKYKIEMAKKDNETIDTQDNKTPVYRPIDKNAKWLIVGKIYFQGEITIGDSEVVLVCGSVKTTSDSMHAEFHGSGNPMDKTFGLTAAVDVDFVEYKHYETGWKMMSNMPKFFK